MDKHEKVITLAAKWWMKRIQTIHHDNGDNSKQGQLAMFLADIFAAKCRPTEEQLNVFKTSLIDLLKQQDTNYSINLSCDYGPNHILSEAAKTAGINNGVFPYKVSTCITPDNKFLVKDGYGASLVEIENENNNY